MVSVLDPHSNITIIWDAGTTSAWRVWVECDECKILFTFV